MEEHAAQRTRLQSFSPIFPVRDLRRALAHYASLGFEVRPYADGDEYGFADRDGLSLHLELDHGHDQGDHGASDAGGHGHEHVGAAYLYVEDADALYDEWARPGLGGLTRLVVDTPYQLRQGAHFDPDGNVLRFGSPMPGKPAERLRSHLQSRYGIEVTAMTELDFGVWRVGRSDGPDWVVRWFPARRSAEAVAGDAEILRYLAARDYPAERCAADNPVSDLDGRAVLVTEWAEPVPRDQRREAIRAAGGLARLGALLGRLHTLPPADESAASSPDVKAAASGRAGDSDPDSDSDSGPDVKAAASSPYVKAPASSPYVKAAAGGRAGEADPGPDSGSGSSSGPADVVSRPGGAWHHLADGLPAAEVTAAGQLLAAIAGLVPDGERAAYEAFLAEIRALDTGDGLPEALVHPDFVLANVVATADAMVLVDWAGAGRGPRVWPLAFLLYAEGAKDLRRLTLVLEGYRRHVTVTEQELGRLESIMRARPLVLSAWSVGTGRMTPTEAMAHAAEVKTLANLVAERTRAVLARPPRALGAGQRERRGRPDPARARVGPARSAALPADSGPSRDPRCGPNPTGARMAP